MKIPWFTKFHLLNYLFFRPTDSTAHFPSCWTPMSRRCGPLTRFGHELNSFSNRLFTNMDQYRSCKCVFYKCKIEVCSSCFLTVSRELRAKRGAPDGVHLPLWFRKQCTRLGPLSRALCQLKKPFKDPRWRRGSRWEERKRIVFPRWGVIDLPSRQINDFSQNKKQKKI